MAADGTSYALNITVEVPDGFNIQARLSRRVNANTTELTSSGRYLVSFPIKFLPPLRLIFTYTPTYPSDSPPLFKIACLWLGADILSALCRALDRQWEEQIRGMVTMFTWGEYLKTLLHPNTLEQLTERECAKYPHTASSLQSLANGTIILSEFQSEAGTIYDERALALCTNVECDLMEILEHDHRHKLELFRTTTHLCKICYEDKPGSVFIELVGCQHFYCKPCIHAFCETLIRQGNVLDLKCPECKLHLSPHVVRSVVPDRELYERYERLLLQRTLDCMGDTTHCPKCNCLVIVEKSGHDTDGFAQCPQCEFAFCTKCRLTWHRGTCPDFDMEGKMRALQEALKEKEAKAEKQKKILAMIAEQRALQVLQRMCTRCPKCKMFIHKTEGCNSVYCGHCTTHLCYVCGQKISGYDHFGGRCALFTQPNGRTFEEDVGFVALTGNPEEDSEVITLQLRFLPSKKCPICKRPNKKTSTTNYQQCKLCKNYFCYVCLVPLRSMEAHYVDGECPNDPFVKRKPRV